MSYEERVLAYRLQLRIAEIELAGWMERDDVPADVAAEMAQRLECLRAVLES